jgi:HDIG domain protein
MKFKFHINNRLNLLLVCVASTLCLLLALPRDSKAGYDYEVGKPWNYAPLIADFEFPIYKSAEQLAAERDSALRTFYPYYNSHEAVAQQQVRNFAADRAAGHFAGVPDAYITYAMRTLQGVYAAGVISSESMNRLTASGTCGVRVVNGTNAVTRDLGTIFSPRTAYEHIMDDEHYSRDLLSRLNLHKYLEANLVYDSIKTQQGKAELLSGISGSTGLVLRGERIIDRGERVNLRQKAILDSLRRESERRKEDVDNERIILFGRFGLIAAFMALLVIYLRMFRRDLYQSPHTVYLIFSVVTIFPLLTYLLCTYKFFSVYIIPFAMLPIVLRVFTDTRTAFMSHLTMVLLASIPLHTNYQFILSQLLAGLVGIYCIKDLTERSQIFLTSLIVTFCTLAFGLMFELAQSGSLSGMDRSWFRDIVISGVALLFTYPLLYLIEQAFGFTSSVTLIELNNTNSPIIRRLAKEAQGTFIHSIQVGNLAAEVAARIGAKVQLVRTGALYHDIGKLTNPGFFTENQAGYNPHDKLTEEESAQIIISHVTKGVELADKHRLPKVIKDFILTHHGASMVRYFYVQAVNKYGEENVDKAKFTYPGPNPFTREQAILMMSDAVEASSRSLKEYTTEAITELVNRIIDGQVANGAFVNCPITFRDISEAKQTFIDSLQVIYHTRVSYPEIKQPKDNPEQSKLGLFGHMQPRPRQ